MSNQPWLVAVEDDPKGRGRNPHCSSATTPARPRTGATIGPAQHAQLECGRHRGGVLGGQRHRTVAAGRRQTRYTTSVGTADDKTTPALSSALPTLTSNTPQQVELPSNRDVLGCRGGSAVVTTLANGHIVRSVTYTDYVNVDGMILNGTESTDQSAAQNTIHYIADITVTGTHTGSPDR